MAGLGQVSLTQPTYRRIVALGRSGAGNAAKLGKPVTVHTLRHSFAGVVTKTESRERRTG
jgi:site-specific recombinase XerD